MKKSTTQISRTFAARPSSGFRTLLLGAALWLSACGGSGSTTPPKEPEAPKPEMTEMQRRQGAACEALSPKLTQCAYESAKRSLTEEEMKKEQVVEKMPEHTKQLTDECKQQQMSSRQVRVYEVCMREESECGPLMDCLENAKPQKAPPAPAAQ